MVENFWYYKLMLFDLKLGDDDGPNLYRVNIVDVSSTFYWKYILVWVDPRFWLFGELISRPQLGVYWEYLRVYRFTE